MEFIKTLAHSEGGASGRPWVDSPGAGAQRLHVLWRGWHAPRDVLGGRSVAFELTRQHLDETSGDHHLEKSLHAFVRDETGELFEPVFVELL